MRLVGAIDWAGSQQHRTRRDADDKRHKGANDEFPDHSPPRTFDWG
jgi:hypothetical protein